MIRGPKMPYRAFKKKHKPDKCAEIPCVFITCTLQRFPLFFSPEIYTGTADCPSDPAAAPRCPAGHLPSCSAAQPAPPHPPQARGQGGGDGDCPIHVFTLVFLHSSGRKNATKKAWTPLFTPRHHPGNADLDGIQPGGDVSLCDLGHIALQQTG